VLVVTFGVQGGGCVCDGTLEAFHNDCCPAAMTCGRSSALGHLRSTSRCSQLCWVSDDVTIVETSVRTPGTEISSSGVTW
jgi:hypothetical protein